jgi:hypothetical protein
MGAAKATNLYPVILPAAAKGASTADRYRKEKQARARDHCCRKDRSIRGPRGLHRYGGLAGDRWGYGCAGRLRHQSTNHSESRHGVFHEVILWDKTGSCRRWWIGKTVTIGASQWASATAALF